MKFSRYLVLLLRLTFTSSLAVGLVLGILMLFIGGAKGSITLDIELSRSDSVWFLVGAPLIFTFLFLVVSPLSFFIHAATTRLWPGKSADDEKHE